MIVRFKNIIHSIRTEYRSNYDHTDGILYTIMPNPAFFNWGFVEPTHGFHGTTGVQKKIKLCSTFAANRRIFEALSTSKMYLWLQLHPKPHWGSLQRSPRPPIWGEGPLLPFQESPHSRPSASNFGPSDLSSPPPKKKTWVL